MAVLPIRVAMWLRTGGIAALLLLASAGIALGATHVYANGTLGAGGSWGSPTFGNYVSMNFNRMSVNDNRTVKVIWARSSGGGQEEQIEYSGSGFLQKSKPPGWANPVRAVCRNAYSGTNLTGYCAWYD